MIDELEEKFDDTDIRVLKILDERADADTDFFVHISEEILAFCKTTDMTIDDLAVSIGWVAGALVLLNTNLSNDDYRRAIDEWLVLCQSAVRLGAMRSRLAFEDDGVGLQEG